MKNIRQFALLLSICLVAVTGFLMIGAARARQQTQGSTPSSGGQQTATKAAGQSSGLGGVGPQVRGTADDPLRDPREVHLRHIKQLTFGGQNAEAYFSGDGKHLIFQSTRPPYQCDQMFTMNVDGSDVRLVSTGRGRTTCGYFYPDGKHILYAPRTSPAQPVLRGPIIRAVTSGPCTPRTGSITRPTRATSLRT